jgi:hypothetical protein
MSNAEKEAIIKTARALDRIAIPLIYAGASPNEAYRAALKNMENMGNSQHFRGTAKMYLDAAARAR